jgi:hypothetical protein
MAVHKDCYAPTALIQQGGPRRRETEIRKVRPAKRSSSLAVCKIFAPGHRLDRYERLARTEADGHPQSFHSLKSDRCYIAK